MRHVSHYDGIFQDGRQQFIFNVNSSETSGPINFISTPTCTISITTYHLDHVTSIRMYDVIMQFQDGRQKTCPMFISQEPTDRSHLNVYCTKSITTYHLDHVISIRIDDVVMQYQDGRERTPQERPQRPQ